MQFGALLKFLGARQVCDRWLYYFILFFFSFCHFPLFVCQGTGRAQGVEGTGALGSDCAIKLQQQTKLCGITLIRTHTHTYINIFIDTHIQWPLKGGVGCLEGVSQRTIIIFALALTHTHTHTISTHAHPKRAGEECKRALGRAANGIVFVFVWRVQ